MEYRRADVRDAGALAVLRRMQLLEEGYEEATDISQDMKIYFASALKDGSLIVWVAEEDKTIVATGGICFYQLPPSFVNPTGKTALATNMFTLPEHRQKGVATQLLKMVMDEAAKRKYKTVRIHASKMGRPVYEKFGFRDEKDYMTYDL